MVAVINDLEFIGMPQLGENNLNVCTACKNLGPHELSRTSASGSVYDQENLLENQRECHISHCHSFGRGGHVTWYTRDGYNFDMNKRTVLCQLVLCFDVFFGPAAAFWESKKAETRVARFELAPPGIALQGKGS
jgi:hypothetical protein